MINDSTHNGINKHNTSMKQDSLFEDMNDKSDANTRNEPSRMDESVRGPFKNNLNQPSITQNVAQENLKTQSMGSVQPMFGVHDQGRQTFQQSVDWTDQRQTSNRSVKNTNSSHQAKMAEMQNTSQWN